MKSLRTGCSFRKSPGTGLFYLYGSQFGNKRILGGYGNVPHGYWKPKTPGPEATGIQAANRTQGGYFRHVRMAAHYKIETRDVRIVKDVCHENPLPSGAQHESFGQVAAGWMQVDVSADGVYRRDLFQLLQYRNLPHVPGVNDRPDASKKVCYLRSKESVGVGDDANAVARAEFGIDVGGIGHRVHASDHLRLHTGRCACLLSTKTMRRPALCPVEFLRILDVAFLNVIAN